ncbi:vacuolar-sorting receptor 3-like [Actinidia eriantha]|uniref:vacuolar-sorting receptor 3-like n=1 Tax=Actinidia eriantha TaxID=165200 RepID=UPI00258BD410|nr:vacuolar-sorting receptor 3-like [Actinidia eriantha]
MFRTKREGGKEGEERKTIPLSGISQTRRLNPPSASLHESKKMFQFKKNRRRQIDSTRTPYQPYQNSSRFMVEKNSLAVMSPDSIRGTHDSAIANFGIPQYSGSMAGTMVYPKDNRKGCRSFLGTPYKSKPGALPNFVLAKISTCKLNN